MNRDINLFESNYKQIADRSTLTPIFGFIEELPNEELLRWLKCIFYILLKGDQNTKPDFHYNDDSLMKCCMKVNNLFYVRYLLDNDNYKNSLFLFDKNTQSPQDLAKLMQLLISYEVYPYLFDSRTMIPVTIKE